MGRKFFIIILLLILFCLNPKQARAFTIPEFPSCEYPEGTLKVHYDDGIHGIPGDTREHRGIDDVYRITESTLLQCFCPPDGIGIETNWWKFTGLTQENIETLKWLGWTYIPNGTLWGLDNTPYLAISRKYICGGIGGGDVLGISTGPEFDFASTGNTSSIYALSSLGSILLAAGLFLRKTNKKNQQ